jgi:NAD(P)-dependent dehydrogenase (short-subunit alcohol dehydrogenase family)
MLNVDDDGSVNDAIAMALLENGRIDVLVNNAGVPGGARPVEGVPMGDFHQIMETNFASSGKRVGDFGPILNCCLLLLLSLWACGQRACVVHHVHSDEVGFKPCLCDGALARR